MMLWLKALHIIVMAAWFAGLCYLPRLFVYHTELSEDENKGYLRFCTMERKLYWGIMTPNAILTLVFGMGLIHSLHFSLTLLPLWLKLKLLLVGLLVIYHGYCGVLIRQFKFRQNRHSARYYRIMNEIPIVIFSAIVLLVVLKPT